jgi:protein tyrosine/serine phosphatase
MWVKVACLLLLLIFLIAGGMVWYYKVRFYHFLIVNHGVLYRSGWLRPDIEKRIIGKYGIKTVVNLCLLADDTYLKKYADEQSICQKNGTKLINMPLLGNTPPSKEQEAEWLRLFSKDENLPILVHCDQGVIRTNIMVAIYQIEFLHEKNETVLKKLPTFGHDIDVPKRGIMRDFILNYKSSRKSD